MQELKLLTLDIRNSIDHASQSATASQQDTLNQLLVHLQRLHETQAHTQTTSRDLGSGVVRLRESANQLIAGQVHSQPATRNTEPADTTYLPSEHSLPMIGMKIQQATKLQCPRNCFCQCHTHSQWSSPQRRFKKVIGALFVGYSRTPTLAPVCDRTSCSRHEKSLITVLYMFPPWVLQRVLFVLLCFTPRDGPIISLRTVRIRDQSNGIFFWAQQGHLTKIQILFKNGEASPFDVMAHNHNSLLSVCTSQINSLSRLS